MPGLGKDVRLVWIENQFGWLFVSLKSNVPFQRIDTAVSIFHHYRSLNPLCIQCWRNPFVHFNRAIEGRAAKESPVPITHQPSTQPISSRIVFSALSRRSCFEELRM